MQVRAHAGIVLFVPCHWQQKKRQRSPTIPFASMMHVLVLLVVIATVLAIPTKRNHAALTEAFKPNEDNRERNHDGLEEAKQRAQIAFQELLQRTEVKEVNIRDTRVEELGRKYKVLPSDIHYYDIIYKGNREKADDSELRGGFSQHVGDNIISHVTLSTGKTLSKKKKDLRNMFRVGYAGDSKAIHVYRDGKGDYTLFHLINFMMHEQKEAQKELGFEGNNNIWCKGCGLSGMTNQQVLELALLKDKDARMSYFGKKNHAKVQMQKVQVTKQSTGKSAKVHYKNADGVNKTFQGGNPIERAIHLVKNLPPDNVFLLASHECLLDFGSLVYCPPKKGKGKKKSKKSLLELSLNEFSLAHNVIPDGCHSGRAWHRDGISCLPTIVSADGGPVKLQSEFTCNAEAGMLVHEVGGIIHGYGARDFLVFSGNNLHCPLPPTPASRNVAKKEKNGGKRAIRESFVMFYKP